MVEFRCKHYKYGTCTNPLISSSVCESVPVQACADKYAMVKGSGKQIHSYCWNCPYSYHLIDQSSSCSRGECEVGRSYQNKRIASEVPHLYYVLNHIFSSYDFVSSRHVEDMSVSALFLIITCIACFEALLIKAIPLNFWFSALIVLIPAIFVGSIFFYLISQLISNILFFLNKRYEAVSRALLNEFDSKGDGWGVLIGIIIFSLTVIILYS